MHEDLREAILALGTHIRYVAVGEGQRIVASQREGLTGASAESSDFYEELIVNPTLLTLTRQPGELDCGGLRHVIVGYGNFNQVVMPLLGVSGHVSVCVELNMDANEVAAKVAELVALELDESHDGGAIQR
jgi:hypothetical protein